MYLPFLVNMFQRLEELTYGCLFLWLYECFQITYYALVMKQKVVNELISQA